LNVSEQKTEQTSGETASLSTGSDIPGSPETQREPAAASALEAIQAPADVESPRLVPEQAEETPVADAVAAGAHASGSDHVKPDDVKSSDVKPGDIKADPPRIPGKIMIMSSGDRAWANDDVRPGSEAGQAPGMLGKRRVAALAAVVALAALAGALGGALATAGFTHVASGDVASGDNHSLEASIARIDADILTLKASVEHTSKLGMSQFNKTSERLDKVEKAQAEPAAKLAKLSEAVEKLRTTPAAAPTPVAAAPAAPREITGSVPPPASQAPPKPEVGRLPTLEGWVIREVSDGGALIEGRQGIFEVYAGDLIPGLGRIEAVRRQDGRWVVVTSKGLVVAR
jgi:hypothetical protein